MSYTNAQAYIGVSFGAWLQVCIHKLCAVAYYSECVVEFVYMQIRRIVKQLI